MGPVEDVQYQHRKAIRAFVREWSIRRSNWFLAAADAQRYANLIATETFQRAPTKKARTKQETAETQANAARQLYEAFGQFRASRLENSLLS